MTNFDYYSPTRFVFGKDTEAKTGELVKKAGARKTLIVFGSGSAEKSGLLQRMRTSLQDAGIRSIDFGGIRPNPKSGPVYKGIEICKKENIDFVLAVGGGSVIDSAKAIAMGAVDDGDFWDFHAHTRMPQKALPIGVVLTIPAAGSEGSGNSVITQDKTLLKRSATGECLRPRFSILNPELTYTLPNYQTACGIADMMSHIFERYFTNEPGVDLTDRMCEGVLKTIISAAPQAIAKPDNYEARATLMWAGTIAHINLLGLGRIEDWSSHAFEHELSALYDVTHGAGLAIVFPAWLRYQLHHHNPQKIAQFATRVFDIPTSGSAENIGEKGIAALSAFWTSLGLPFKLKQIKGFEEADIPLMTQKIKMTRPNELGNYNPLNYTDIETVYRSML
ncbi:MAG: iron-containing alcohol dehydrogenase [Fibrobacteraceae bacterium]|nr:iron-containing alcohol dehydrogenase [Fibrobacteraceae bacterium]